MDWRHRAICRDEDPELFFETGTSGPALLQIAEAKTVCRRCPVVADCLAWALGSGQDHGTAGGLSADERRAIKRRDGERTEQMLEEQCQRATGSSRAELARRLIDEGMTAVEVAARLTVDPSIVRRWTASAAA